MPAQIIFGLKKIHDKAVMAEYRRLAHPSIEAAGGRIVVGLSGFTALEGDDFIAMVVVEFPTREAAEGWYRGAAYQEASKLRKQGSDCSVSLVSW